MTLVEHEPSSLRILGAACDTPLNDNQLAKKLGLSRQTVSKYRKKLVERGLLIRVESVRGYLTSPLGREEMTKAKYAQEIHDDIYFAEPWQLPTSNKTPRDFNKEMLTIRSAIESGVKAYIGSADRDSNVKSETKDKLLMALSPFIDQLTRLDYSKAKVPTTIIAVDVTAGKWKAWLHNFTLFRSMLSGELSLSQSIKVGVGPLIDFGKPKRASMQSVHDDFERTPVIPKQKISLPPIPLSELEGHAEHLASMAELFRLMPPGEARRALAEVAAETGWWLTFENGHAHIVEKHWKHLPNTTAV
jgi:biotin operon repressor